ncbi:unnamed protein product, partial [Choristocarpus tenellus]
QVFLDNKEIKKTKVIPMTLFPIWDEAYTLPGPVGKGPREGLRFEIWDHDAYGSGDFLGAILYMQYRWS